MNQKQVLCPMCGSPYVKAVKNQMGRCLELGCYNNVHPWPMPRSKWFNLKLYEMKLMKEGNGKTGIRNT
jgi:hypothetical protein